MPVIVFSDVIRDAYRLIKISRVGVSLICPLYAKEESIGKKLYYRKIKYITLNAKNFKVYLQ